MSSTPLDIERSPTRAGRGVASEASSATGSAVSGVSWAAVFAGAVAAAALSLVLVMIGTGLGLAVVSPWQLDDVTAAEVGVSTIGWLTLTQLLASALGGYMAGRLRVKWVAVHTDEVYFRDTAHGLLSWAIATLTTAMLVAVSVSAIVSGGAQAVSAAGGAAAGGAVAVASADKDQASSAPGTDLLPGADLSYSIDKLFRSSSAAADSGATPDTGSVARIFVRSVAANEMSREDRAYIAQLVAQRSGASGAEAEKQVDAVFNQLVEAKQKAIEAADDARKATAAASLWMAFALFVGAFCASLAATIGGRQRDNLKPL